MKTRIVPLFLVSAILIGATPDFPSLSMSVKVNEATIVFGPPRATPNVTGAAYSADEVLEQTKTLPDGTHTAQSSVIGHLFRDSQGRTRVEQAWKAAPIWITEIFDPVRGFAYILDEQKKIAHRMAMQPSEPQPVATRQSTVPPQTTTENLGTRTIEGVIAEGTLTTTTVPAGRERNGLRTTFTIETWDSQELKVTVLTRSSNGYTSRLTNLSRVEPDPMQFQPPAHYNVVDDKGSFTMTVKFQ
jgi:hypothetical protein